jgi:hypothetical protein
MCARCLCVDVCVACIHTTCMYECTRTFIYITGRTRSGECLGEVVGPRTEQCRFLLCMFM